MDETELAPLRKSVSTLRDIGHDVEEMIKTKRTRINDSLIHLPGSTSSSSSSASTSTTSSASSLSSSSGGLQGGASEDTSSATSEN